MKPVEYIAVVITATICIVILSAVISTAITGIPMENDRAEMVGGMIDALIAIVSMFVGSEIQKRIDKGE